MMIFYDHYCDEWLLWLFSMIMIVISDYYDDVLWCSMSMSMSNPEGMFVCNPHENYETIYLRLSTINPNYGSCKMYVNQL